MSKKHCNEGLDDRCRDQNGQIRAKNGSTLVRTLRETHGDEFAPGVRSDMKLDTLLELTGAHSLTEQMPGGCVTTQRHKRHSGARSSEIAVAEMVRLRRRGRLAGIQGTPNIALSLVAALPRRKRTRTNRGACRPSYSLFCSSDPLSGLGTQCRQGGLHSAIADVTRSHLFGVQSA